MENVSYAVNGQSIVKDITFSLYAGQCTALVGANGAGKTTLIKLINGLLKPGSGQIHIMGQNTAKLRAWQIAGQVGTAFQNPNSQFFKLTVEEEILVAPKVQHCLDKKWIDELVAIFRLEPLLHRAPFKLSGGEKKRVAFAAALAAKPDILVLDEPTAGQDSRFRQALVQCLTKLAAQGSAVLVVTHALNFLRPLTHRWLVMANGHDHCRWHAGCRSWPTTSPCNAPDCRPPRLSYGIRSTRPSQTAIAASIHEHFWHWLSVRQYW